MRIVLVADLHVDLQQGSTSVLIEFIMNALLSGVQFWEGTPFERLILESNPSDTSFPEV